MLTSVKIMMKVINMGHEHGTKKKSSESQTGVETMASKIPIGRSNH